MSPGSLNYLIAHEEYLCSMHITAFAKHNVITLTESYLLYAGFDLKAFLLATI